MQEETTTARPNVSPTPSRIALDLFPAGMHLAFVCLAGTYNEDGQEALVDTGSALPGEFGEALRDCREECGLSPQELAEEAAIPVQAIESWERGEDHGPTLSALQSLAHALDMTTCELIEAAQVN